MTTNLASYYLFMDLRRPHIAFEKDLIEEKDLKNWVVFKRRSGELTKKLQQALYQLDLNALDEIWAGTSPILIQSKET